MKLFILLLLLHHTLAQFFNQEECVIDNRSLENMWESKLMHDLVNCSSLYMPPIQNGTEPLIVRLKFLIKTFKFNSEAQELSTLTRTIFSWEDERFKWDPKKYDGLESLLTTSVRMWTPGIRLINGIEDEFDNKFIYMPCELVYKGVMNCLAQLVFKVKCIADLRDWPYDTQYCKMEFGTYLEIHTKIQFDIGRRAFEIIEQGAEWIIKDYQQTLDGNSEKQVILKFRLERHTEGLAAIVIYPSMILSALTLSCLLIDARLDHRLMVVCFSLMCHFIFLMDLTWVFPENTKDSPSLLMYCRGSLIMTSFLVVVTFVLNIICRKDMLCPDWITSINDLVFMKVVKIFVWPRWETKVENGASNYARDWTDFANIINAVSMFLSIVVYISLYCVFMPRPNSVN